MPRHLASLRWAMGPTLLLALLSSPLPASADVAAPPRARAAEPSVEEHLVPEPPADDEAQVLRARLRDIEQRSELATALYISSFVHLGGALAGLIGAIPVGIRSTGGLYAMIGSSIASFVGHVVTLSVAIHFDVTSGARRRRWMEDFLRQRVVPALEGPSDGATLVEALF